MTFQSSSWEWGLTRPLPLFARVPPVKSGGAHAYGCCSDLLGRWEMARHYAIPTCWRWISASEENRSICRFPGVSAYPATWPSHIDRRQSTGCFGPRAHPPAVPVTFLVQLGGTVGTESQTLLRWSKPGRRKGAALWKKRPLTEVNPGSEVWDATPVPTASFFDANPVDAPANPAPSAWVWD